MVFLIDTFQDLMLRLILFLLQVALTLVFVETKRSADSLENWLRMNRFPAAAIHGDKVQMVRLSFFLLLYFHISYCLYEIFWLCACIYWMFSAFGTSTMRFSSCMDSFSFLQLA